LPSVKKKAEKLTADMADLSDLINSLIWSETGSKPTSESVTDLIAELVDELDLSKQQTDVLKKLLDEGGLLHLLIGSIAQLENSTIGKDENKQSIISTLSFKAIDVISFSRVLRLVLAEQLFPKEKGEYLQEKIFKSLDKDADFFGLSQEAFNVLGEIRDPKPLVVE
jgi:hypothetical protein